MATMPTPTAGLGLTTVAARAILGPSDGAGGRAGQVARQLERAICTGVLHDGDRLPAEPQLAAQMRVATVTLREALATLRERGLITTRRGRGGGTFVVTPSDYDETGLVARLRALGTQQIRELGDHRFAIIGTAAYLAAGRAVPSEIDHLSGCVARLAQAKTTTERGRADAQFVLEMTAASQSARLTGELLRLRAELGDLLWWQLPEREQASWVKIRAHLLDALRRRDAARARALAERQVRSDTRWLLEHRLRLHDDTRYDGPATGRP